MNEWLDILNKTLFVNHRRKNIQIHYINHFETKIMSCINYKKCKIHKAIQSNGENAVCLGMVCGGFTQPW